MCWGEVVFAVTIGNRSNIIIGENVSTGSVASRVTFLRLGFGGPVWGVELVPGSRLTTDGSLFKRSVGIFKCFSQSNVSIRENFYFFGLFLLRFFTRNLTLYFTFNLNFLLFCD